MKRFSLATPLLLASLLFCAKPAEAQVTIIQEASQRLTVLIFQRLAITTSELPDGITGLEYEAQVEIAGRRDVRYLWTLEPGDSLPPGLVLDSLTGAISGTPTGRPGATEFVLRVTEIIGN